MVFEMNLTRGAFSAAWGWEHLYIIKRSLFFSFLFKLEQVPLKVVFDVAKSFGRNLRLYWRVFFCRLIGVLGTWNEILVFFHFAGTGWDHVSWYSGIQARAVLGTFNCSLIQFKNKLKALVGVRTLLSDLPFGTSHVYAWYLLFHIFSNPLLTSHTKIA